MATVSGPKCKLEFERAYKWPCSIAMLNYQGVTPINPKTWAYSPWPSSAIFCGGLPSSSLAARRARKSDSGALGLSLAPLGPASSDPILEVEPMESQARGVDENVFSTLQLATSFWCIFWGICEGWSIAGKSRVFPWRTYLCLCLFAPGPGVLTHAYFFTWS